MSKNPIRTKTGQPVVMYQRWRELLFLHWSLDPNKVQASLPPGLRVDTYSGHAWVGIVPFFMSGVRPRFLPALPGVSSFQELNLRTYVVDEQGRPGVWFYSLDTSHRLPVWIARQFFHLNYLHARMSASRSGGGVQYRSSRRLDHGWDEEQTFAWARKGSSRITIKGTLEHFLAERYRLFAYDYKQSKLYTGCVEHEPYQIQEVALDDYSTRLFSMAHFEPPQCAPAQAFGSKGVDVKIYPLHLA